jgi:hypothetical protein
MRAPSSLFVSSCTQPHTLLRVTRIDWLGSLSHVTQSVVEVQITTQGDFAIRDKLFSCQMRRALGEINRGAYSCSGSGSDRARSPHQPNLPPTPMNHGRPRPTPPLGHEYKRTSSGGWKGSRPLGAMVLSAASMAARAPLGNRLGCSACTLMCSPP